MITKEDVDNFPDDFDLDNEIEKVDDIIKNSITLAYHHCSNCGMSHTANGCRLTSMGYDHNNPYQI